MVFCANCGAEIKDLTQNFCEKCGSSISANVKQKEEERTPSPAVASSMTTTSLTPIGFQPYDRPGGLFDLNRNYYILKEK